jgi:threonine dehydrogenase-like Zn-dependent dehydrogenase
MCSQHLYSQCETTQNREHGTGASFFGYSKLYGQVPGGQAEYLRVPFADFMCQRVPEGPPDDRFLFLSDVLPTAWQGLQYADVPKDGSLVVLGAGPIGDMATRMALHEGLQVITVDHVPERLQRVAGRGAQVIDLADGDVGEQVRDLTGGRGADAVIDAVGMEAHGSPVAELVQKSLRFLPRKLQETVMLKAGTERLAAFYAAIDAVRRGGTISVLGVYGGAADPIPMFSLFDKQVQLRMGQANVRRWTDDLMPFLTGDDDPLGVESFATHHLPLEEAPDAYAKFQAKEDGYVKVVFQP